MSENTSIPGMNCDIANEICAGILGKLLSPLPPSFYSGPGVERENQAITLRQNCSKNALMLKMLTKLLNHKQNIKY